MQCLETHRLTKHISTRPCPSRFSPGWAGIFVPIQGMFFVRLWLFCWICSALNSPSSGLYFFQLSYFMYPGSFHPALYPPEQRLSRIQSLSLLPSRAQEGHGPSSHISLLTCGSICSRDWHLPLFSVCHLDHVTMVGAWGLGNSTCCPSNFTLPVYQLVSEVSLDQQ